MAISSDKFFLQVYSNIFITGTPATGKTALAHKLSTILEEYKVIELNDFMREHDLLEEFDEIRKVHVFTPEKVEVELNEYLRTNNKLIIVGAPLELHLELIKLVIVLICLKPAILRQRMSERGYNKRKIEENIAAELIGEIQGEIEAYYPKEKILIIDTCKYSIDECITIIKEKFLQLK